MNIIWTMGWRPLILHSHHGQRYLSNVIEITHHKVFFFFWFDDSNLHYTHAHTVWGGQRGFEPLPNGREFSLAPLGQMPSGHHKVLLFLPLSITHLLNSKNPQKKRKSNMRLFVFCCWIIQILLLLSKNWVRSITIFHGKKSRQGTHCQHFHLWHSTLSEEENNDDILTANKIH